jgi:hypothetical protein
MKITGAKAAISFDSYDASRVITGTGSNTTTAKQWYWINKRGANSNLPYEGAPFFGPSGAGATQKTLVVGDELYPFDMKRLCKTSADVSMEQGTVDVSDDCDPGATILDGVINISGSVGSLFRYDDTTGNFDNVTNEMINRFLDIVEDDGAQAHLVSRTDSPVFMAVLLNSNAKAGQIENWLILPISISSMSLSLGNTDAQSKDMSWSKGEGKAVIYRVPRTA